MTAGDVQVGTIDGADSTARIAIIYRGDGRLEIADERRTLDGWRLAHRIIIELDDVASFGRTISRACSLAGPVRK